MHQESCEVFLSQIISGILLFKKEFNYNEINTIMALFYSKLNCDILDNDSEYDMVYNFMIQNDNGYKLSYDYDSILKINGKKINLYNYLKSNTTVEIIEFLMENFYCDKDFYNKRIYNEICFRRPIIGNLGRIKQKKHGFI